MLGKAFEEEEGETLNSNTLLSYQERAVYFAHQIAPRNNAYNIVRSIEILGAVNTDAMSQSFSRLIERHGSLRARYRTDRDGVHRSLGPARPDALLVVDHRLAEESFQEEVDARIRTSRDHRYDLENGPLISACLVLGPDHRNVLVLAMHHIVSDSWSLGILYDDLLAFYEEALAGASPTPGPSTEYDAFARLENQRWSEDGERPDLAFWKDLLRDAPPLDFPADKTPPRMNRYRGERVQEEIGVDELSALAALENDTKCSRFMSLLAFYSATLARFSNQYDFVIGAPVANRADGAFDDVVGMFTNMIPIRLSFDPKITVSELLTDVRDRCIAALEHQHVPFEKIVEAVQPDRGLGHAPIFQVAFTFHDSPLAEREAGHAIWRPRRIETHSSKFDLGLHATPTDSGLSLALEYDGDLFHQETATSILKSLISILLDAGTRPKAEVHALRATADGGSPVGATEEETAGYHPPEGAPHAFPALFTRMAEQSPDSTAVVWDAGELTYGALRSAVHETIIALNRLSIRRGTVIGVYCGPGPSRIVATLACLAMGNPYLPLDPEYPARYLRDIVDDARPRCIIVDTADAHPAIDFGDADILAIGGGDAPPSETPAEDPVLPDIAGEEAAYIVYSSGSTGRPNGIRISHAALLNRMLWGQDTYPLNAQDRVLQLTPFSFDFSVWEICAPLAFGARVVFPPRNLTRDIVGLMGFVRETGVTTVRFTPSVLASVSRLDDFKNARSLRYLFSGGEALPRATERRVLDARPDLRFFNQYGPAEAAIDVAAWRCRLDDVGARVPIGSPISNCQVDIVDDLGRRVPRGAVGEIQIRGVCLANGYLNRPRLDDERFGFAELEGGGRRPVFYRTGDLGRLRVDGAIEFLGRRDHQFSVRGYRVELGEVEAALSRCAGVREAAVGVRRDAAGFESLAAIVVWDGAGPFDVQDLKKELKALLPDHLIPSQVTTVPGIPKTPAGKIDRVALRTAIHAEPRTARPIIAYKNEIEEKISEVWAQALGLASPDPHANFFDIGGHSLLLVTVKGRLQEAFDKPIGIVDLFRFPTISELAEHIAGDPRGGAASDPGSSNTRLAYRRSAQRSVRMRHRRQQRSEQDNA